MGRLSNCTQCNHQGPYKKEARGSKSVTGDMMLEARTWSDIRKGPRAKECRKPLETEKTSKWLLPWSLQKEGSSNDTLILDISPPELQENKMCIILSC